MKSPGFYGAICAGGFLAIAIHAFAAEVQSPSVPRSAIGFTNADFELGAPGELGPGWFVPKVLADAGFSAVLTTNQPAQGRRCLELRWPGGQTPPANLFANVMQRLDATPWRGRSIRVTAAIRVAAGKPGGRAQMWLRVDRPGGMGAFDNMNNRPVVSASWADYSITADVAEDASTINLGLMAHAGAMAWWDDIRVELQSEFQTLRDPPHALSETGLSNLVAFSRLLGCVRHFHPSDQAASNDWFRFVVKALPTIEAAKTAEALAMRLETEFRRVAPTVRVCPSGVEPALPRELVRPPDAASARVRFWEHVGYRQDDSSAGAAFVYSSQRRSLSAADLGTLPTYAQPTNVYRARLGAGVMALVPTAVFTDDHGTVPHVEPEAGGVDPGLRFGVDHRGARLATVMLAWNILQHFYPYFDVVDTDWSTELEHALRKAATDAGEAEFYRTLNRLIAALQDGHGTLSGPGMPVGGPLPIRVELIEERLVVVAVATNVTTVRPGDVVESIEGVPARAAYDELAGQVSAATPQRRKQVAYRFGWGPPGSEVKLQVRGPNATVREVTLARVDPPSTLSFPRPPKVHEIRPGVVYVDITRLTDTEFKESLPSLAQAKGLVFDLRGYPTGSASWLGHLSREPLQCAHWNIAKQHRPDRSDVEWTTSRWSIPPAEPLFTTNRVFLTDGSAISYAETVMGIIEAYGLGEIIGEPTAGTNGNVVQNDLPLGYRMLWTGMKVLKHDGSRHHGVGIRPTVPVAPTLEGIRQGRDEPLERALERLR